ETPGGLVARDPEACIPPGLRGRVQHQEDAASAGAGTVLCGSTGAGRRSSDGGAAAADVPGRRDARWGAGRAAGGVAALLRAGHVGDGEAARDAEELGGGSAVVILTWLLRPPVMKLYLVELCSNGADVLSFMRKSQIQYVRTQHH